MKVTLTLEFEPGTTRTYLDIQVALYQVANDAFSGIDDRPVAGDSQRNLVHPRFTGSLVIEKEESHAEVPAQEG